jgi:hypothetical protein
MLFLIQGVFSAGVGFDFLDSAYRFALVVVFEKEAIRHELTASAAAMAFAVSTFIARL